MEKHTDVLQQPPPGELTLALEIGATSSIVMPDRIACTVCQHEIPASEALVAEATDYVVYFCGLDCYERWRNQQAAASASADLGHGGMSQQPIATRLVQ